MSDSTDRTAARAELIHLAQPSASPALTESGDGNDVDTILDRHKRASTWAAETEYAVGAAVVPAERNGHMYLCVRPGVSGEDEPSSWPTGAGRKVADGDEVVWQEAGPLTGNVYDVRAAAHEAWVLRATRSAGKFDISLGGQRFDRSQVYDHCMRMAASFAPVTF